ncbi:hypothetical protein [Nannocystis pusilla]
MRGRRRRSEDLLAATLAASSRAGTARARVEPAAAGLVLQS